MMLKPLYIILIHTAIEIKSNA